MKYCFVFIFFSLIFCQSLKGDSPQWHLAGTHEGWKEENLALKYFHHSELQRQWAWHLLATYPFSKDEKVLDFGCGEGKITAEVSHFIPDGFILGVDLSPSMIAVASRCFPSIYYPNLSFVQKEKPFLSEDRYDLIYSLCVFHLIPNPVQVLSGLRQQLTSDGRLLLVIPCGNNPALFEAAREMFKKYQLKAPWDSNENKTNQESSMRTPEGCKNCLINAGFEPLSIKTFHTPTAFYDKEQLVAWMIGTMTANWQIPLTIAESFFNDLADRMSELDQEVIAPSGAYHMKLSRIEVVAKIKGD